AHERHQQVRARFSHLCGYCGVSETDSAGELSVDHYHRVCAGGDDSDDNLIYCCARSCSRN
ncbi:MAG TPA: HNH endonuclease signature motif containing protein, partial [Pirellulales bacterium]|nr:HNH endonuclease signature motif containing protein [Pirellulales bacterium]